MKVMYCTTELYMTHVKVRKYYYFTYNKVIYYLNGVALLLLYYYHHSVYKLLDSYFVLQGPLL